MKVAFKDDSFAFDFVRNLGFVYYGVSDVGLSPCSRIHAESGSANSDRHPFSIQS
jgi:hypothetical protein